MHQKELKCHSGYLVRILVLNSNNNLVVLDSPRKRKVTAGNSVRSKQKMSLKRTGSSSSSSAGSKPGNPLEGLKRKVPAPDTTAREEPRTSVIKAHLQDLGGLQQPSQQPHATQLVQAAQLSSQAAQLQAAQLQGVQLQAQLQAQQQAQALQVCPSSLRAALTASGGGTTMASFGALELSRSRSHAGPAPAPGMSPTGATRKTVEQEQMQRLLLSGRLPPSAVNLALAGLAPAPPADLLRSRSFLTGQTFPQDVAGLSSAVAMAVNYPPSVLDSLLAGNTNHFPTTAAGTPPSSLLSQLRSAQLLTLQAEMNAQHQQSSSAGGVTGSATAAAAAGLIGACGPSNIGFQRQQLLRQLQESSFPSTAFGTTAEGASNNIATVTLSGGTTPSVSHTASKASSAEGSNKRMRRSPGSEPAPPPKETILAVAGAIPPALPPAAKGAAPHFSERLFISLATDEDQNWLSEFQVCRCICLLFAGVVPLGVGGMECCRSRRTASKKKRALANQLTSFTSCHPLSLVLYPLRNPRGLSGKSGGRESP